MSRMVYPFTRSIAALAIFLFLSACNLFNPPPDRPSSQLPLQSTVFSPTHTQNPSASPQANQAPSNTDTVSPPGNSQPPPTPAEAATSLSPYVTPADMEVKIFLIAMEDGGKAGPAVGCGDSAVSVIVRVPFSPGVLRAALSALLANHNQFYGESGLYNALYQSRLAVEDVAIASGTATIHLSGALTMGGECDAPRVEAQLKQTALQFSTVHAVSIFINGHPLSELLSGR
jgi:hypothetical protein